MKARIGIITMLALGLLLGGAGAAVGYSALSTDTSASAAQYGRGEVLPVASGGAGDRMPPGGVAGVTADSAPAAAQAPRQVAASSLPFTGYAAIPLLLAGLALLAGGLVLRGRTGRRTAPPSTG
ncbi:MAG TPA: hypothetical protein VNT54_02065 [Solirubrobacteraceae bacterium]|nr:hypothetical protein [Solirubrobacteraceae bacterium]